MQRVSAVRGLAAVAAILVLGFLPGCGGGGSSANSTVTSILLTPSSISLNEGGVAQLSAIAQNSAGVAVAADITFSSSNSAIATVSSSGLICGGVWDANIINCVATSGQAGVGTITITATATANNVTSTATVYVHLKVDQVTTVLSSACTSMGQPITISGKAYSTSAPGCSPTAPCDITSTVGPFTFGTNDSTIAASSAGIVSTYSSTTNTPTYTSGGTITGSKGQTCNLSAFNGVTNATATVPLTGANTIASGTQLTITSPGYGATVAPTAATLTDGTATCSGTAVVQTAITSGVMTAISPGLTTLFSSVSGVNSVGASYQTCSVASIVVHGTGGSGYSFTLAPGGTQGVTADVLDTRGQAIVPTLSWGSSSNATATVAATGSANAATVTAVTGGTTSITASCSFPTCNKNVSAQYGQNVVTIGVTPSVNTTVYAASTQSKMLVPISTATNTASAAIALPDYPNSIVADPAGQAVYLGSGSVLMAIAANSTTVTTFSVSGTILAISADGQYLLISDAVHNQVQYFNVLGGVVVSAQSGSTALASAYTPDSKFNAWVSAVSTKQLGVGFPTGFLAGIPTSYTPSFMDMIAPGGLIYVTSAADHQVDVYSTCNQAQNQVMTANSPTLIRAIPNGLGAVAIDPPSLDLIYTPSPLAAGCPVSTQSALTSYDLGVGSFTPSQLLVSLDSSAAWVMSSSVPSVIRFDLASKAPSTIGLAGGAMPNSGSLSLDGTQLWVGASDNAMHRIDTVYSLDAAQVAVNLTDANGGVTPPNLVSVLP